MLYVGNIDPRDGGECRITKEFRLLGSDGYIPDDGQNLLAAVRCMLNIHAHCTTLYEVLQCHMIMVIILIHISVV